MAHSVEQHLATAPAVYDLDIRRFVPGYDAMLHEAIGALEELVETPAARVLDLGAGTGALADMIAKRFPMFALTLLDEDASMLERARQRLGSGPQLVCGSFADRLPPCDAAVASLSLHHVRSRKEKRRIYRRIVKALAPGGVFVNADAAVPSEPGLKIPLMQRWAAHLVAHGDTEQQAFDRFAQWAKEDRYFSIDDELEMLDGAGFAAVDVRWRAGPMSVIVARQAP